MVFYVQGVIFGMTERGGSSSRRATISSSRPLGSTELPDSSGSLSSKMVPISLRTSGTQRGSPVASAEPKRTVTSRHQSSNMRNYEAALKGVESLSVEVEQRQ